MDTIIALAGPAQVGKTSIAKILASGPGLALDPRPWRILSFAAPIKRMAAQLLPAAELAAKDRPSSLLSITPRRILQTLGTEWGRALHPDLWVSIMLREITASELPVVIDDLRFDNEARLIRALGGKVINVSTRPGLDHRQAAHAHASEAGISQALIDYTVVNQSPGGTAQHIANLLS
jgi:hypothetical protein